MKIILSIDGGGIRGIVPAAVLSYLEEKIQDVMGDNRIRIGNLVDFVAGTSTGSIVGSLMLLPNSTKMTPKYKMSEIVQMYFDLGDDVFKKHFWHNLKTMWGIFGPQFPNSNIEEPLFNFFGHHKLDDLLKPCMFSGYDITKRRVNFYTNRDENKKYAHYYVKDVVRGSTSIPAYFKPAFFQDGVDINTIVDGGLFANNPAMSAYVEVSKTLFNNRKITKRYDPHNLIILSLGTGEINQKSYKYKKVKRWGKAQWMLPSLDVLLTSHSEVTNYQMEKLFEAYDFKHNYKRINPPIRIASSSALDASKNNLTNLLKDVNRYIEENKEMLNTLAREICDLNFLPSFYS